MDARTYGTDIIGPAVFNLGPKIYNCQKTGTKNPIERMFGLDLKIYIFLFVKKTNFLIFSKSETPPATTSVDLIMVQWNNKLHLVYYYILLYKGFY